MEKQTIIKRLNEFILKQFEEQRFKLATEEVDAIQLLDVFVKDVKTTKKQYGNAFRIRHKFKVVNFDNVERVFLVDTFYSTFRNDEISKAMDSGPYLPDELETIEVEYGFSFERRYLTHIIYGEADETTKFLRKQRYCHFFRESGMEKQLIEEAVGRYVK